MFLYVDDKINFQKNIKLALDKNYIKIARETLQERENANCNDALLLLDKTPQSGEEWTEWINFALSKCQTPLEKEKACQKFKKLVDNDLVPDNIILDCKQFN